MIFCSWVIRGLRPCAGGRVAVPARGENRAPPPAPLRKPTPSVRLSPSYYIFADCCLGQLARLQNEDYLVVLQCQRLREAALFFPGKRILEIVTGAQRPMQVLLIRRRFGKTRIVVGHEGRQQSVSFSLECEPRQAAIPSPGGPAMSCAPARPDPWLSSNW